MDLRVVDMLVVDVRFDMDEMTTIGMSVLGPGHHTRHGLRVR